MKVLRIILSQNKAHYKKEEVNQNKLTYPLPPFSTVIGAIHNACGFTKYKSMNLSIQGEYKTLSKQAYVDYCFHDRVENDRAMLIKLINKNIQSKAFLMVAKGKKNQGNDFLQEKTIDVYNRDLLDKYRDLKELSNKFNLFKEERINKVKNLIKIRKKSIKSKLKKADISLKKSLILKDREKELTKLSTLIDKRYNEFRYNNITIENEKYALLTTSLKFYEILHEVKLIIHIDAHEKILNSIKENIYNLKSIGRSEDFVDIKECKYVELVNKVEDEIISDYSAYLNYDLVKSKNILLNKRKEGIPASGTKYWINKIYDKSKGYRDFKDLGKRVKVIYASKFLIDDESDGVYYDKQFIVNFS